MLSDMFLCGLLGAALGALSGIGARRCAAPFTGAREIPRGWCEGACAVGAGTIAAVVEPVPIALALAVVCWWCVCLCAVDVRVRRLPNRLTLPGAAVVVASGALGGAGGRAIAGAALLGGVYLLVHLVSPRAMGAGDVKLALGLGGICGLAGAGVWLSAAAVAPVLTATIGVLGIVMRALRGPIGAAGSGTIAHGPSMCLATIAAVVWAAAR